jgi:hypothetical protein
MLDMFYGEQDDSLESPDMSHVSQMCSKDAFYYGMNPRHMMAVDMVKSVYMSEFNASNPFSAKKFLQALYS